MKILAALLVGATLALSASAKAPEAALDIKAPSAVLIERETGTLLYAKGEHERRPPASVTKVMTMLLIAEAVDSGALSLDDMVTGSAHAAGMGGSQVWLEEGEALSVSDMLKCIAVVSANDCAVAMAEHLSGTEKAFAERMNERAAELGCENTHFTNCTGLFDDPEHYTTAYDIALMSRELLRHSWIRDYTTIWMDSIRGGEFGLSNTNKLLRSYEGCTGLKTGYTSTAMYCLSASAERDGTEYIAVIMHGDSIESRNNDAKALLSFGFANWTLCPLRAGEALPPVRVELGVSDCVQPVYEGGGALLLEKRRSAGLEYSLDLPEKLQAPVYESESIGSLRISSGADTLAVVPLLAGASVERLSVWGVLARLISITLSAA